MWYLQWSIISLKNCRVMHTRSRVLSVWSERKCNFVAEFFGRNYMYDDGDDAVAEGDDAGDEKNEGAREAALPHTICTRYAFVAFICGKIATDLAIHILYGFCTSNGAFLLLPMNQSWRIRKNESHKSTRIYTINKTKQNKTKRCHVLYHVHTTMYRYQLPIDSVPT